MDAMTREAASIKREEPPSRGRRQPSRSAASHTDSSYAICNFSIDLQQPAAQGISLCIHDDFIASEIPVVVHLGRGSISLGTPPPAEGVRHTYDIESLLAVPGETELCEREDAEEEEAEEEEEGEKPENKDYAGALHSRRHRGSPRRVPSSLTRATRSDPGQRQRKRGIYSTVVAIVLFIAYLIAARSRPEPAPVPEYTEIKPLSPSPDASFLDLMLRHAAVPHAIVESGATDKNIYMNLRAEAGAYCTELRDKLHSDWLDSPHGKEYIKTETAEQRLGWMDGGPPPNFGPADAHARPMCDELIDPLYPVTAEVVVPLHSYMISFWGAHAVSGLLSASSGLAALFPVDGGADSSPLLLDGGDNVGAGRAALNASFAIPALRELSRLLTLPRELSKDGIALIPALNKSLGEAVVLGDALLGTTVEQWFAMNRPPGCSAAQAEAKGPTKKVLQKLVGLRNQALLHFSALKSAQSWFSGPAAEALAVTGVDVDQLKEWMDGLVAGRGWTRLVRHGGEEEEEKQWVQDWYYFSPRPDLPAWLNSQGQDTAKLLQGFEQEQRRLLWEDFEKSRREMYSWKDDLIDSLPRGVRLWILTYLY